MLFGPLKNTTITVAPLDSTTRGGNRSFGSQQEVRVRRREATEQELSTLEDTVAEGEVLTTDEYEFAGDDGIWLPGADTTDDGEAYQPAEVTTDTTLGFTLSQAII